MSSLRVGVLVVGADSRVLRAEDSHLVTFNEGGLLQEDIAVPTDSYLVLDQRGLFGSVGAPEGAPTYQRPRSRCLMTDLTMLVMKGTSVSTPTPLAMEQLWARFGLSGPLAPM